MWLSVAIFGFRKMRNVEDPRLRGIGRSVTKAGKLFFQDKRWGGALSAKSTKTSNKRIENLSPQTDPAVETILT